MDESIRCIISIYIYIIYMLVHWRDQGDEIDEL